LRPTPISRIDAWAQTQAVEEVYSLAANALNDDRIGRAPDEVPAQTMNGQPVAKITYGFTGKEDPTRKQLTLSLSVAADGGIPAWYRLADGNAADTRAYLAHLTAVRERLQLDKPLVVGDSKLITRANMLGFCRVGARFIGPTSLKETDRLSLRRLWAAGESLHRLDEPADGQESSVGRYWGSEQGEVLPDPEQATQYALRRLFVQSLDDRKAARHQRALWTIKGRLRPVYRQLTFCQLCPPMIHMGTAELANVQRKVAEAVAKVKQYVETEVIEMSDGLDVRWRLQPECLRQDAQFDGFYCVLTNEAETQAPMQAIFRTYKEQSKVERRFRMVKQPPIQAQVLDRLGLMKPVSYLQPTITPHPT